MAEVWTETMTTTSKKIPACLAQRPPYMIDSSSCRYKSDLDDVLEISANLSDEQKMLAEFFDDKLDSIEKSTGFVVMTRNLTLPEYAAVDLSSNIAAHDALIFVWQQKTKYDAVRPVTAARYK